MTESGSGMQDEQRDRSNGRKGRCQAAVLQLVQNAGIWCSIQPETQNGIQQVNKRTRENPLQSRSVNLCGGINVYSAGISSSFLLLHPCPPPPAAGVKTKR